MRLHNEVEGIFPGTRKDEITEANYMRVKSVTACLSTSLQRRKSVYDLTSSRHFNLVFKLSDALHVVHYGKATKPDRNRRCRIVITHYQMVGSENANQEQ